MSHPPQTPRRSLRRSLNHMTGGLGGHGSCSPNLPLSALRLRIPPYHIPTKRRKLLRHLRRRAIMRPNPPMLRRKTERHRDLEIFQSRHLPIEPRQRVRPESIRPAQPRAQMRQHRARASSAPHHPADDPRNETIGKFPFPARIRGRCVPRAWACRVHPAAPCGNGGSTTSPQPPCAASSRATRRAGRTRLYQWMRGVRPCSIVRSCGAGPIPALPPRRTWKHRFRTPRSAGW